MSAFYNFNFLTLILLDIFSFLFLIYLVSYRKQNKNTLINDPNVVTVAIPFIMVVIDLTVLFFFSNGW